MRRIPIPLLPLLIAGLLAGVPGTIAGAEAQDAGPAATPAARSLPPILAEWAAAYAAHDVERLLALYAPDAVYEQIPTDTVARGTAAIRAFFEFTFAAYAEVEVRPEAGVQGEGWAVLEGDFAGRYPGDDPRVPADFRRPFAVRVVAVFELDGGVIQRTTEYFDGYRFLVQIGLLPGPATPTP